MAPTRAHPKEPGHKTPPFPNGKVLFHLFLTVSPVLQISGRSRGTAVRFGGAGSTLPARLLPAGHTLRARVPAPASPARRHISYRRL